MTFREATDEAFALGLTAADLAAALGLKPNTVRAMRLGTAHGRTPPVDWAFVLAAVARQRGAELLELAERVEGAAIGGDLQAALK